MARGTGLSSAGLFAGIGGLERGLESAGVSTRFLCELDPCAQEVLEARFPGVGLHSDITKLKQLPKVDLVAAGFPCQDLSQAGQTSGIFGEQSGLIDFLVHRETPGKAARILRKK
ncbi:MAG: DNA cytosine methyltransferase [Acidobacteria bacterium]|nr:DNA cytosine methyltransferase [Acidobacteriota bacterium]